MDNSSDYLVRNPKLVLAYFSELIAKKCILSAHFNGGKESFLTTIVNLNKKSSVLSIDGGPNQELNNRLLHSSTVFFHANCDGVKVSFNGKNISLTQVDNQPTFEMPLPNAIFWLQRRQFYRAKIPLSHKNTLCEIGLPITNTDETMGTRLVVFHILDLSVAGLAFVNPDEELAPYLTLDTEYLDCQLYLHDGEHVRVSLVIKNITQIKINSCSKQQRIGAAFSYISPQSESCVQHYVQDVERLQKNFD